VRVTDGAVPTISRALEPSGLPVYDVNGYYASLRLIPNTNIPTEVIARAARSVMYDLHPDRGEFDPERWERVDIARDVLTDPVRRAVYDRLVPPMKWVDRLVAAEYVVQPEKGTKEASRGTSSPWSYYLHGRAEVPEYADVWMTMAVFALDRLGQTGRKLKMGFTDAGRWHWTDDVLFVPQESAPSMADLSCWLVVRFVPDSHRRMDEAMELVRQWDCLTGQQGYG